MLKYEGSGCGCAIAVILFNVLIGAWTFSYDLWMLLGKQAPWWVNALCGLIGGEITVPLAIILWLLNFAGIHTPIIH